MKTLGINIDGVIRMFYDQFDKQYRKVFIHNPSLVGMDEDTHTFKPFTEDEESDFEKKIQERERDLITLPVESFELINHYKFDSKSIKMSKLDTEEGVDYTSIIMTPKQNLEDFIETYAFQLFTMAEEYSGSVDAINKIQHIGLSSEKFDVVLFSTLKGKSIPATYSFLGKTNCRVRKILFLSEDSEKWEHCDVLVDITPTAFQTKPKEKISIKITHLLNQWDATDYSFSSIKEMANQDFLNKIFTDNK